MFLTITHVLNSFMNMNISMAWHVTTAMLLLLGLHACWLTLFIEEPSLLVGRAMASSDASTHSTSQK